MILKKGGSYPRGGDVSRLLVDGAKRRDREKKRGLERSITFEGKNIRGRKKSASKHWELLKNTSEKTED